MPVISRHTKKALAGHNSDHSGKVAIIVLLLLLQTKCYPNWKSKMLQTFELQQGKQPGRETKKGKVKFQINYIRVITRKINTVEPRNNGPFGGERSLLNVEICYLARSAQ